MPEESKKTIDQLGTHLKDAHQDTIDEGVPAHLQALIDENLKKGLEETLQEGIPDRFRQLLAELDAASGQGRME